MTSLYMDVEADRALRKLDSDPLLARLADKVNALLDALEDNPADPSLRRRRFMNGLWCVTVIEGPDEWVILWEPHPTDPEGVIVQYLGPASFA